MTTHANIGAQISALVEAWGWSPKIRAFREWILDCVAQDPVLRGYPRREP